jgi:tetratricopeptide (TPR) repeat protein
MGRSVGGRKKTPSSLLLSLGIWPLVVLALWFPVAGFGQSAEVLRRFQLGNDFYRNGQYREAAEQYEGILALGYESPELYYNLGNCYYRLRQIGKSVLYLERARRLAPNDEDIAHNLEVVRLQVVDKIPEIPRLFIERALTSFRALLSVDGWAMGFLLLYVGAMAAIILRILFRKAVLRLWSGRFAVFFGALAVAAGLFWVSSLRASRALYAVIMEPKVDVRSAPEENATEVFSLHEGSKVRIRKQVGDWCEIRLPDGKVGWVKESVLGVI